MLLLHFIFVIKITFKDVISAYIMIYREHWQQSHFLCEIWGSHGSDYDCCFLGHDTISSGSNLPVFLCWRQATDSSKTCV